MAEHAQLEKIIEDMQDQKPTWAIDETKYVWITDNYIVCCGEPNAMVAQCKYCEDTIECQYHNDWDSPHCEGQASAEVSE